MMRYSNKELIVIGAIAELKACQGEQIELDAIVDKTRPVLDPQGRQERFRAGLHACIRNLQRKLIEEGLTLRGNDNIGRGNKSAFRVAGDYTAFLRSKNAEV